MSTEFKIKALHADVLVSDMYFGDQRSSSGLIILDDNSKTSGIYPRWARVAVVGPEQRDVAPGDWILIAHGRWSRQFQITTGSESHTVNLRKVDVKDILMSSPERPTGLTLGEFAD